MISEDTSQTVQVTGFQPGMQRRQQTRLGTVAIAYDDPQTYTTFILIFHQSLIIPEMKNNLLCPFQLRLNGIEVNETPLQFLKPSQRTNRSHLIVASEEFAIPLDLNGVSSGFFSRKPNNDEIDDPDQCPQIEMTYEDPVYDPEVADHFDIDTELRRDVIDDIVRRLGDRRITSMERTLCSVSRTLNEGEFIGSVLERNEAAIQGTKRKGSQTPEELAKKWGIGVETARRTIDRTTQLAVRDFHDSAGTRRLKHTYMQLQYRRLNCVMYTDTLFGPKPSSQKNTCGQVYSTAFDWCVFYPMKAERDAHLTLDLLHNDYGVPKTYTPDNAMALVKGNFEKKVHRVGSLIHPIEAHTPNQNKAESIAREI